MNCNYFRKIVLLLTAMLLSSLSYAESVWIDVRSPEEHAVNNIEGDILIVHEDIVSETTKLFPDKSTEIHLYCRSGRRANEAMLALKEAGYNNVSNAGGIDDVRKERSLSQ